MSAAPLEAKRTAARASALRLVIGISISAVLLWLTLREIDLTQTRAALARAQLWYLVPAVLTYFLDLALRTWRWHVLLRGVAPVRWRKLYPITTLGYMSNALLPMRMGEVIRATLLRREGVSFSVGVGSIATERLLDGLTTIAILVIASRLLPLPDWMIAGLTTLAAAFLALLTGLLFMLFGERYVDTVLAALGRRLPLFERARPWLAKFVTGSSALRQPGTLVRAIGIGLLAWSCSALQYYWIFRAFSLPLNPAAAFFTVCAVGLSSAVPSAPSSLGVFEGVGVAVLGVLGIIGEVAFGAVLVVHLLQIIPVSLAGAAFAWRLGLSSRMVLGRTTPDPATEA